MMLSELIDEFVTLKIEGAPSYGEWQSIDDAHQKRVNYYSRLDDLKKLIDAAMKGEKT